MRKQYFFDKATLKQFGSLSKAHNKNWLEMISDGTMDDYTKKRIIQWLNEMQSIGGFYGFPEDDMEFEDLPDNEIEYYFLEWYFTEDDEILDETGVIKNRKKLLENITQ